MKKNARELLDAAFADFDTSTSRVTAGEGEDPGAEQFGGAADGEGEDEGDDSTFDLSEDESEDAEVPVEGEEEVDADMVEGEGEEPAFNLSEGEEEEDVESPVVDEDGDGDGVTPVAEDEDDEDDDAVYATVEEVEIEIQAIAKEQGLDKLPKGVTAAETIDYLLSTNAIIELTPITAAERKARHAAFAADEAADEFGDDVEDSVESPVVEDDENYEEQGEEIGDSFEGIDLSDIPDSEDDESSDDEEESEAAAAPAAPAAEAESCEGEECDAEIGYHPVADANLMAEASAADVQMILTNGEDPRWNVLVAGVPAACIKLSSLENAASVRATFCSDVYRDNVTGAMQRHGVVETLVAAKAEFYANSFKKSDLANEIRASVAEDLSKDHTARVIAMREDFLDRARLVVGGLSRGYFSKMSNPLLAKARTVLAGVGVHPTAIDAAALEIMSAAPDFFAVASEKAVELMDKSQDTVDDLRQNIEDSAPRAVSADAVTATASFSSRLADQSMVAPAPVDVSTPKIATASSSARARLESLVGRLGSAKH